MARRSKRNNCRANRNYRAGKIGSRAQILATRAENSCRVNGPVERSVTGKLISFVIVLFLLVGLLRIVLS